MARREATPTTLPLSELTAVSPLDGRYRRQTTELAPYVSEYGLIKLRIEIEARYLIALSDFGIARRLTTGERTLLASLGPSMTVEEASEVKRIEDETQHDVKAVERFIRGKAQKTSLDDVIEKVHFALTSEDVNNLAYRLMLQRATHTVALPALTTFVDALVDQAEQYKTTPMLARTHGQAAVPTTLGKEFIVFASRLNEQTLQLQKRKLKGKVTGAVGNFNAFYAAYPNKNWVKFSQDFVRSFGFAPNLVTTQINPYEDIIEYLQNYKRINGILLDFDQDMWRYISDYWLAQELRAGEVGSSTMPQKINPIFFENSEGNIGMANALLDYFATKLAVSRLQRDLSDSTVIRNLGVPLGYSLVAYRNAARAFSRVRPNEERIRLALHEDWAILGEGIQIILRASNIPPEVIEDAYALLASRIQGKHFEKSEWLSLIDDLPVGDELKERLKRLTPENYIGIAVRLTTAEIRKIRLSRKK